ncbi:hypothetical protein [Streptomyces platensis]|uniref:hypothetical protein n=1 Tax=Streptomyces platensis TaxID=58346 RepID=UPI002E822881|nr:hypothetical protein [Streptomyces platensis]WUB78179.1 hypothetical protein OG424_02620 [Streptomyces platensis]
MASTAETNLLKPARGTVPSPLRVSTTDELEYGTVVLRFGRELSSAPKVYCKGITLKVPTGPSATDLTVEPSLITTAVSKVEGEAQGTEWWVDRNTTDPNEAVFSFVPDTTAVFDGTWAVSLTLSGIEVNPSIGTVDLKIEELTSTTGADESYQKRTGQVTVKKGNDEFYFRSLRPRTTVIERGLTVDLLWDAPADNRIQYTMYYRKADGTETHDSVQSNFAGRVWKSPTLVDHTNFTLKATIDGKDYFLTTSLTVNKPDVVVNKLSANSDITMAAAGTLTTNGPVRANNDVTVKVDKTLSTGDVTIDKDRTLKVTWVDPTVATGTITARGHVAISADKKLTAGVVTASGLITANDGLAVKSDKTLTAGDVTIDKDRTLKVRWVDPAIDSTITVRGNVAMAAGKNITIPQGAGQLVVADALVAKSHSPGSIHPKVEIGAAGVVTDGSINLRGPITGTSVNAGSIASTGAMTRGGKAVVAAGDSVSLESLYFAGKFLNGSSKDKHSDNSGVTGEAAFYRGYDGASKFKIAHR